MLAIVGGVPTEPMLPASAGMLAATVAWLELLRRSTRTRPRTAMAH